MTTPQPERKGSLPAQGGSLNIVMDGSPLIVETGGIRRYVEELSIALARGTPGDAVHVVAEQPVHRCSRMEAAGIQVHDEAPQGWNRRWWLAGLLRACHRLEASVFHGTDFAVPYLHRLPAVLTIHDLSPWMNPAWQPDAQRVRRRTPWLLRLGLADQVITVSEAIRGEVLSRFRLPPERVHAIPLAAGDRFQPVEPGPGASPYFLYLGTLEPRKNIPALVEAWKPVYAETGIPLKLAGRRRADFQMPPALPGLEWLGAVPDPELPALYSGALAAIYPSAYEGFGLPVLEAMQCGAPVIVGNAAAVREVAADAAIAVTVEEGSALRDALRRIALDADWRRQWSGRSLRRAALFSWEATALQTREVYMEAIARFERTA